MDENTNKERLFQEFPPVGTDTWKEKITADLKGADYEKKLIWNTYEGFPVRPFYRKEDLNGLEYLQAIPDEVPYVRGTRKTGNRWMIRQDIGGASVAEANAIARDAVAKGAEALGFCVKDISSHKEMSDLLNGIDITRTAINFTSSRSYPLSLELLIYELNHREINGDKVSGSLNFDSHGYLLLKGDFYQNEASNMDEAVYLINTAEKHFKNFRIINVNAQLFSDAGATIVQELGFGLASAAEYLYQLTEKGVSIDDLAPKMQMTFGIGSNYFLEIAKLRAARLLWARIVEQFKPAKAESMKLFIHSVTSTWNKTTYDPYVNMLRTTTEGMSSVLGNTDSLTILPFDIVYKEENEFSSRIARNQQLILREEAYLDKVADPAAGSYYLENLTHSIAFHAWELFRQVEEKGGFLECVKSGFIQDEIAETCRKKDNDIASRKVVILGTNQYPNPEENMLSELSKDIFASEAETTPKYKVLRRYRGAEGFERLRIRTEEMVKEGKSRPSVFLLSAGNLAMRKARATFATNFFGCAGFRIIDNPCFNTPEDGIKGALASDARFIVICSSDEEYATLVPPVAAGIKTADTSRKVIVAGYPKDILEDLKKAGVDDFIHIRSNVLETLTKYQSEL